MGGKGRNAKKFLNLKKEMQMHVDPGTDIHLTSCLHMSSPVFTLLNDWVCSPPAPISLSISVSLRGLHQVSIQKVSDHCPFFFLCATSECCLLQEVYLDCPHFLPQHQLVTSFLS